MSTAQGAHDAEIVQTLDDEIAQLEAHVISLKRTRNTFVPIARLHQEVLQEIFFLAHISSPLYSKGKTSLLITWVSYAWRDLAHHASNLWTHVDFLHSKWFEAALTRTSNRVLEYHLDCSSRRYDLRGWAFVEKDDEISLTSLYLGNLPRTKILEMTGSPSALSSLFVEFNQAWEIPAPLLVELHLHQVRFRKTFLSGVFPSLQVLVLKKCRIDWCTFPATPSLKTLSLDPFISAEIQVMVKILRGVAPTLEELILHSALNTGFPPTDHPLPQNRLRLDHLKVLRINQDETKVMKALLDQLALPDLVDMEFQTRGDGPILAQAIVSAGSTTRLEISYLEFYSKSPGETTTLRVMEDVQGTNNSSFIDSIHDTKRAFSLHSSRPSSLNILEYFGARRTINTLCFDPLRLVRLNFLLEVQNDGISTALGFTEETNSLLNQDEVARGRNIIWFHTLETFIIYDRHLDKPFSLIRRHLEPLRTWLTWRKKLGLPLMKLVMAGVIVPPASWLDEAFGELVGEIELHEVGETIH
ncbi:hypothetical protein BDN72DRAFT_960952 [Pluteus cervinus]|uniref:Uncharacterized protein n=1 Tax=Pluteus cervinus TaxID=181527 RepID=A0ACD3AQF8_9AGAR|nr:hypothetical protein BDN72DRAFT_960952 [Pluteus cervinus]